MGFWYTIRFAFLRLEIIRPEFLTHFSYQKERMKSLLQRLRRCSLVVKWTPLVSCVGNGVELGWLVHTMGRFSYEPFITLSFRRKLSKAPFCMDGTNCRWYNRLGSSRLASHSD